MKKSKWIVVGVGAAGGWHYCLPSQARADEHCPVPMKAAATPPSLQVGGGLLACAESAQDQGGATTATTE